MNKFIKYILVITALPLIWVSCTKDRAYVAKFQGVDNYAYLRIVHISPNFRAIYGKPDSMNLMVDGNKMNGTLVSFGALVPSSNTSNAYLAVNPGTRAIELALPNKVGTTPDSTYVLTKTKNLTAGSYYSLYITDNVMSSADASQIWLNDNFTTPSDGTFSLRFIHGVLDDAPNAIDIYSIRAASNIFSAYTPGQVSNFIQLPYNTLSDTLIVRRAGTTTELARMNAVSFSNRRVYTLYYKGSMNLTGAKAKGLAYDINL
ncbi:MAG: DUF4397 domain-containing protein [Bacteroidota bacterium]|nr:DUF4397 domain-containing protein [Bacteroidota bacterium]